MDDLDQHVDRVQVPGLVHSLASPHAGTDVPQLGADMSAEDNKVIDYSFAAQVLTEHDLDMLPTFVHEDFVEQNPPPGQGPGREGLREFLEKMFTAFPDLNWTVHDAVADGDTVAAWSTWEGTHKGEFFGIGPTGRQVRVEAWTFDYFRDGKIAESRIIMDTMGLMQQLGALPPPASRQ